MKRTQKWVLRAKQGLKEKGILKTKFGLKLGEPVEKKEEEEGRRRKKEESSQRYGCLTLV